MADRHRSTMLWRVRDRAIVLIASAGCRFWSWLRDSPAC